MSRPNLTEQQYEAIVKRHTVRGGVDATRKTTGSHPRKLGVTALRAGSNPAPSPYRSKWEEQYAYELTLEQRAGFIKGWAYEDMTFKLAAGKYHRPDFLIWHLDGSIEIAQVKGHHKNLRASLTALTWAAQQRPWFRFTVKRRDGRGWESYDVKV